MLPDKIWDTFTLFRRITPSRCLNIFVVWSSYWLSRLFNKPFMAGMPISISVEPTTSCNLRCPECPSGLRSFSRPTGMLQLKHLQLWISQISSHALYLNFYFQGEPFLNPDFLRMVKFAIEKRFYVNTSTNAHYLSNEMAEQIVNSGLHRMIISIDGVTQDVYEQYRIGGSLHRVLQGTKNVVQAKRIKKSRTPYLIFQFLVVKPNEHQVDEARKLAKEYGVDEIRFKTAQIYGNPEASGLLPENTRYARYIKNKEGQYVIKNQQLNHCWRMWHSCVITWDGTVVPCCFDKDATHAMGNLQQHTLYQIWFGKLYRHFRSRLLLSRKNIDICANCTEGTKVWTSPD